MVMSGSTRPTCYIIAGANGAGKTTFALNYLPKIVSCRNFINVDEIARGVSPLNIEAGLLHASRIFLQLMRQKIAQREDFAFETTLSGKSWLRRIRQMQNNGWRVVLYYLYIPSAAVSKSRVKQRVEQGGHDIPIADLERRYPRSVTNLFAYTEICDVVICLDNSTENAKPIFEKKNAGGIEIINQELYQQIQEQATHD
jgi:predicted ABC-type ATPase